MDDGALVAIDTANFKIVATSRTGLDSISSLQLNAQGLELFTSSHDGKLCVWNVRPVQNGGNFELMHEVE
jgi:WD40 repeat protein